MMTGNKKMNKMPDKEMCAREKERMEKFLEYYHKARNWALLKLGVFTLLAFVCGLVNGLFDVRISLFTYLKISAVCSLIVCYKIGFPIILDMLKFIFTQAFALEIPLNLLCAYILFILVAISVCFLPIVVAIACKAYAKRQLKDIQTMTNFQYNAEVGRKIFGAQNS